jgi:hypothetical protein
VAQRGLIPVALILLVLVLLGAAVATVAPGSGVSLSGSSAARRVAEATVVDPAPCGPSTPGDLVEVQVNGVRTQARLDGCGHLKGERLQVEVPTTGSTRALVVRLYTPAATVVGGSMSSRLNWVLLTLAAIAGGGYMLLLRSRPAPGGKTSPARNTGLSAHLG